MYKHMCSYLPDSDIAPMGFGASLSWDGVCESAIDYTDIIVETGGEVEQWNKAQELFYRDMNDCDTLKAGLAETVCDLHCVRDSTMKGDRMINQNMQRATETINRNIRNFAHWTVDSTRDLYLQTTGKVAEKIKALNQSITSLTQQGARDEEAQLRQIHAGLSADFAASMKEWSGKLDGGLLRAGSNNVNKCEFAKYVWKQKSENIVLDAGMDSYKIA